MKNIQLNTHYVTRSGEIAFIVGNGDNATVWGTIFQKGIHSWHAHDGTPVHDASGEHTLIREATEEEKHAALPRQP